MDIDIDKYLHGLKERLTQPDNWRKITLDRKWTANITTDAGVYTLKENDQIVYVGETGNLRERMNDLLDSRHHTVRRTIGERLFSKHEGFSKATTKKKFPDHIELLVNSHICNKLSIAHLTVSLGRKELEELIDDEIIKEVRLNKRAKRKIK